MAENEGCALSTAQNQLPILYSRAAGRLKGAEIGEFLVEIGTGHQRSANWACTEASFHHFEPTKVTVAGALTVKVKFCVHFQGYAWIRLQDPCPNRGHGRVFIAGGECQKGGTCPQGAHD